MKFLVVGASGLVGRHVLAYLRSCGYDAVGTESRHRSPDLVTFDLLRHRLPECVGPDFFDASGPVVVVVAAAISQIDRCARERELCHMVNVEKTMRLIEDVHARGAVPVFLSSSFVFDGRLGYYDESYPTSPISEYGRQKAALEAFLEAQPRESLVLRLDKIVSDGPWERHLFSEWFRCVRQRRPIMCMGDQVFAPTFADDVGSAIIAACERRLTGLYHVANAEFFSRAELARHFVAALGEEAEVVCVSQEELNFLDLRPSRSYLNSGKFVRATGLRFTPMRHVFQSFIQRARLPLSTARSTEDR